jgi:hypothetical protein
MATFSLGGGVTPGAPGVYINEQAGIAASAAITSFSTVYMLVETEGDTPVTLFPFNKPIPVTSLNDYRVLLGGRIPATRIPQLSYNCVNEFFQNSQVGDLRVVRVGTPNQIVELEFLPSGSKINTTSLPSSLMAGNVVYVQMIINGLKLVAGDGSTGYTADGEWLGVPVVVPVNYVAGDEVNNRKISKAMADAVAAAIESNPSVRASVYVRSYGQTNDLFPALNSETSYVTIAASTFDGNVSVVTEVMPVGSNFVFMQNTYDINNIVGEQVNLERVPQDYQQCIDTAFDGQQDQGYLVTPTAYAQFDADGRAAVGATAARHCESNNFKWMALADPGPFLVTDVNKYKNFTPHKAAANLVTGLKYLVDNAIYEWVGTDVNYDRLNYQSIVYGDSAKIPVFQATNTVADGQVVGLLDSGIYVGSSQPGLNAPLGKFQLNTSNIWPVTLPIQKVVLGGASGVTNDLHAYNGTEVYVVAPPNDTSIAGDYSQNWVYLTTSATVAATILNQVTLAGGTSKMTTVPPGAITGVGTGSTFTLTYADPYWDLPVNINGQVSDLIENISGSAVGVNTLHLPGTLQDPTNTYRLSFASRTIYNPAANPGGISPYGQVGSVASLSGLSSGSGYTPGVYTATPLLGGAGSGATADITVDATGNVISVVLNSAGSNYYVGDALTAASSVLGASGFGFTIQVATVVGQVSSVYSGAVQFNVPNHGILNGQKLYFTQAITVNGNALIKATTKLVSNPYYVTVINASSFVVSNSLGNFSAQNFVRYVNGFVGTLPTVYYTDVFGGGVTSATLAELGTIPMIRARKYAFDSNSIFNQAASSAAAPTPSVNNPGVSIYFNNSAVVIGEEEISPFGEVYTTASWLSKLNLVDPSASTSSAVNNAYCVPTVDQNFQAEAYMVPAIDPIYGGTYNPAGTGTKGPATGYTIVTPGAGYNPGTYSNVYLSGGTGNGAVADITVDNAGVVTAVSFVSGGWGYGTADSLTIPGTLLGGGAGFACNPTAVATSILGETAAPTTYVTAANLAVDNSSNSLQAAISALVGVYFEVITAAGFAPDGTTPVAIGDRMAVTYNGSRYSWTVIPEFNSGGDLTTVSQPCYGTQVLMSFSAEQTPPANLWRFDAITSTEIIDRALRGVGFNGIPQAVFVEAGIDNVNRLLDDSQMYSNPFGFIAFYGPWILNASGQYIPPSPYVTGVAVRRYRSEGYQFPPAGVKYQLADAVSAQIPINSAQQNLLNPKGCNAIRTLPGYPQSAVFIWGGRTRLGNPDDAQQKLYQFVNTRVILNVVYGSLRAAFDSQIFNVIDGFGVVFNQIISVGNSILNQLYVKGALFGSRPSEAFQVICDNRINPPADLENGIVNAKVFVTPVPTLERIQIDLIRVAIGQMQNELDLRGLGTDNSGL